jgi:hypothetical protein
MLSSVSVATVLTAVVAGGDLTELMCCVACCLPNVLDEWMKFDATVPHPPGAAKSVAGPAVPRTVRQR